MQTFYHFFDKLFQVDKFTYKKMHFLEKKCSKILSVQKKAVPLQPVSKTNTFGSPSGHKPTKCLWTEEEKVRAVYFRRGRKSFRRTTFDASP